MTVDLLPDSVGIRMVRVEIRCLIPRLHFVGCGGTTAEEAVQSRRPRTFVSDLWKQGKCHLGLPHVGAFVVDEAVGLQAGDVYLLRGLATLDIWHDKGLFIIHIRIVLHDLNIFLQILTDGADDDPLATPDCNELVFDIVLFETLVLYDLVDLFEPD